MTLSDVTGVTVPAGGVTVLGGSSFTQATTSPLVTEVHAGESGGVQWQIQGTSEVSEFLRKMNAERLHLEQTISRDEETDIHKLLKEQVRHNDNYHYN